MVRRRSQEHMSSVPATAGATKMIKNGTARYKMLGSGYSGDHSLERVPDVHSAYTARPKPQPAAARIAKGRQRRRTHPTASPTTKQPHIHGATPFSSAHHSPGEPKLTDANTLTI